MIFAEVYVTGFGSGGLTRNIQVTVRSDADGIGSVELRDKNGVPLAPPGQLKFNCSRHESFDVPGIPTGRFPVFVWASECANGQPSGEALPLGPFVLDGPGGPQQPGMCPPPTCWAPPSDACVAARNEAGRLRNELLALCSRLHGLRAERDRSMVAAAAFYFMAALFTAAVIWATVSAATVAAIPGFGWVFAAALAAIAAAALALAVWAGFQAGYFTALVMRLQREISSAERELAAVSERFRAAAMAVRTTCCPGDYSDSDVTLPAC